MQDRRGPATVTGSIRRTSIGRSATEPLGEHRFLGRRGGRPGSQETCLRPGRAQPSRKGRLPMLIRSLCAAALVALLASAACLGRARHRSTAGRRLRLDDLRRPRHDRRQDDRQGRRRRTRATAPSGRSATPGPTDDLRARRRLDRRRLHLGRDLVRLRRLLHRPRRPRRRQLRHEPVLGLRAQLRARRRRRLPAAGASRRRGAVRLRLLRRPDFRVTAAAEAAAVPGRRRPERRSRVSRDQRNRRHAGRGRDGRRATATDRRTARRASASPRRVERR